MSSAAQGKKKLLFFFVATLMPEPTRPVRTFSRYAATSHTETNKQTHTQPVGYAEPFPRSDKNPSKYNR